MAALLRQEARRIGGSVVQRTRAAFTTPAAAEERRLLTTEARPFHSINSPVIKSLLDDTKVLTKKEVNKICEAEIDRLNEIGLTLRCKVQAEASTATFHARPEPPKDPQAGLREIQERKEELYDLISSMEETSMPKSYQNRELLKFLSVQVKPRLADSQWRRMRQSKKSKDATDATILVSTCILGYQYWSLLAGGKEVAETTKKEGQ